jgi:hypothetical protein
MNPNHLNPAVPVTRVTAFIARQVVRELVSRGRPMVAMARPSLCGGINRLPSSSTGEGQGGGEGGRPSGRRHCGARY